MFDRKYPISGHTELDDAADHLAGFTYKYKSPTDEPRTQPNGGRYAGVIAQNLQKHPLTAQTVQKTPGGLSLEMKPLVSLLSAEAGRGHDRMNAHEQAISGVHGLLRLHGQHIHHVKQVLDQHSQMLSKLHDVLKGKFGP